MIEEAKKKAEIEARVPSFNDITKVTNEDDFLSQDRATEQHLLSSSMVDANDSNESIEKMNDRNQIENINANSSSSLPQSARKSNSARVVPENITMSKHILFGTKVLQKHNLSTRNVSSPKVSKSFPGSNDLKSTAKTKTDSNNVDVKKPNSDTRNENKIIVGKNEPRNQSKNRLKITSGQKGSKKTDLPKSKTNENVRKEKQIKADVSERPKSTSNLKHGDAKKSPKSFNAKTEKLNTKQPTLASKKSNSTGTQKVEIFTLKLFLYYIYFLLPLLLLPSFNPSI